LIRLMLVMCECLLGQPKKMGAGTNAQERLVALHHIDSSMHNRPSDIEQREGRIIRQGNILYERDPENFMVDIIAYSTAKTFDAVSWQTLARKAEMLEGFRKGARTIEENNSDSANYMEFMAETTGNPIFKEKIQLEGEIEDLEADERRIRAQLSSARHLIDSSEHRIGVFKHHARQRDEAVELINESNDFSIGSSRYKRDMAAITQEEQLLYNQEMVDYESQKVLYEDERKAWKALRKSERGLAPTKPVQPESPTLDSSRMDRSEEALFYREIKKRVTQDHGPSRITFYAGNLEYSISKCDGLNEVIMFDVQDEFEIIRCDNFSPVRIVGLVNRIRECADPYLFSNDSDRIKKCLAEFTTNIEVAKRLTETVSFKNADLLQAKVDRYKEIQDVVGEIEEIEAERRRSSGNRYVEKDVRRFVASDCLANSAQMI